MSLTGNNFNLYPASLDGLSGILEEFDDTYLRLDTTNDPLTNNLTIQGDLDVNNINALGIITATESVSSVYADLLDSNVLSVSNGFVERLSISNTFANRLSIANGYFNVLSISNVVINTLSVNINFTNTLSVNDNFTNTLSVNNNFTKTLSVNNEFTNTLSVNNLWVGNQENTLAPKNTEVFIRADTNKRSKIWLLEKNGTDKTGFEFDYDGEFSNKLFLRGGNIPWSTSEFSTSIFSADRTNGNFFCHNNVSISALTYVGNYLSVGGGATFANIVSVNNRIYLENDGKMFMKNTNNNFCLLKHEVENTQSDFSTFGSTGFPTSYYCGQQLVNLTSWTATESKLLVGTRSSYDLVFGTNDSERMRILANGNVGIGTSNDAGYKLNVNGNGYFSGSITNPSSIFTGSQIIMNSTGNVWMRITQDTNANYIQSSTTNAVGQRAPLVFGGWFGSDESMRIASNGNVGIGTTNPQTKLHIQPNLLIEGQQFTVGGSRSNFYPVVFDSNVSWDWSVPYKLCIERGSVHVNGTWLGSLTFIAEGHSNAWGNQANFSKVYWSGNQNATYTRLVGNFIQDPTTTQLVVYLRGNLTYAWSGEGIKPVFLNPNGTSYTIQGGSNTTYNTTTSINASYDRLIGYNDDILGIDASQFPTKSDNCLIQCASNFINVTTYFQKIGGFTTIYIPQIPNTLFGVSVANSAMVVSLPLYTTTGSDAFGTCMISVNGGAYYLTCWRLQNSGGVSWSIFIYKDLNLGLFTQGVDSVTVRPFTFTYY